jgi:hypothetical protein
LLESGLLKVLGIVIREVDLLGEVEGIGGRCIVPDVLVGEAPPV